MRREYHKFQFIPNRTILPWHKFSRLKYEYHRIQDNHTVSSENQDQFPEKLEIHFDEFIRIAKISCDNKKERKAIQRHNWTRNILVQSRYFYLVSSPRTIGKVQYEIMPLGIKSVSFIAFRFDLIGVGSSSGSKSWTGLNCLRGLREKFKTSIVPAAWIYKGCKPLWATTRCNATTAAVLTSSPSRATL